jgi:hypothetical protein
MSQARSTKGVKICIIKHGAAGTQLTATAATSAKPAVVTFADVTGLSANQLLVFDKDATGIPELDGKTWTIGTVNAAANTLTLLGSDTSSTTGTFVGKTDGITHHPDTDMVCLCLSQLGFNPENPSTISVATFCDPTATIASSTVSAGTVDIGGYVDVTSDDYQEILLAGEDGNVRTFRILLPNNGVLMFDGVIGPTNWDIPLEGAVAWSAQVVLSSKPKHYF